LYYNPKYKAQLNQPDQQGFFFDLVAELTTPTRILLWSCGWTYHTNKDSSLVLC
jgi:hypothetical protein